MVSAYDSDGPAEVFHPSEYICDELEARGWTTLDVAKRMKTSRAWAHDLFCIDLYLCVHDDNLFLDDETCEGLARAFDVSPQLFRNLDTSWRKWPDRRSPFTPPESIFSDVSRSMLRVPG